MNRAEPRPGPIAPVLVLCLSIGLAPLIAACAHRPMKARDLATPASRTDLIPVPVVLNGVTVESSPGLSGGIHPRLAEVLRRCIRSDVGAACRVEEIHLGAILDECDGRHHVTGNAVRILAVNRRSVNRWYGVDPLLTASVKDLQRRADSCTFVVENSGPHLRRRYRAFAPPDDSIGVGVLLRIDPAQPCPGAPPKPPSPRGTAR